MVVTAFPSHPTGSQPVKVRILADTICQPHGAVAKDQIVSVSIDEFFALKHAGKAELYVTTDPQGDVVTDAHVQFLASRGYKVDDVAGAAQFVANLTDPARAQFFQDAQAFAAAQPEGAATSEITMEQAASELQAKTKADLVVIAKENYGLDLSESSKKDDLITSILEAAVKK